MKNIDDDLFGEEEKEKSRLDDVKRRYKLAKENKNDDAGNNEINLDENISLEDDKNSGEGKKDNNDEQTENKGNNEIEEIGETEYSKKDEEINKVIEDMGEKIGLDFSEEQVAIIKHHGAPLNVLAGAGSGKTTILVVKMLFREIYYGIKPLNTLAITFTSKARYDMEDRYRELRGKLKLKKASMPTFRTFHALFLMLLQSLGKYENHEILVGNRYWNQLSRLVKSTGDTEMSKTLEEMFTQKGNIVNKGFSKDGIENEELYHESTMSFTSENYKKVMEKYKELKENDGYIDFDDMQMIIYNEVVLEGNQEPVKAFRRVWGDGDVYIDEYQDISKIQRVIMDDLVQDFNRFTVIGDDDQSIYSWRGSDPTFIIDFLYHYENAVRLKLTTNYRCRSNILDPIIPSIEKNIKRVDKEIKAHEDGGYVELLPIGNNYEPLIDALTEEVDGYEGIMYGEVAVLVRQNSQRVLIADGLVERGIPVNIVHENNSLQNTPVYKNIMEVIKMIKEEDNKIFVKHGRKIIPQIGNNIVNQYNYKDETWYKDVCKEGKHNVHEDILKTLRNIKNTNSMYNAVVYTWMLLKGHYKRITDKGYGSMVRTSEMVKYISQISKGVTVAEFKEIEKKKESWIQLWVGSDEALKIDTLHSVKGLEFDTVYMIGVDGNIIPDMGRYDRFMKDGDKEGARNYIEEERRLFYVGWTRAKERLFVSYKKDNPSIFLQEIEMDLEDEKSNS